MRCQLWQEPLIKRGKNPSPSSSTNVWNRWKMGLDLIIDDKGDNSKVELKHWKLYCEPSNEAENL